MPLFSVMEAVKDKLDGLISPDLKAANAQVAFPSPGEAPPSEPQLFVWSREVGEARQTMGMKKLEHEVGIYVLILLADSGAGACRSYFQHLDAIVAKLRAVPLPMQVVDPDTQVASEITILGERFKVQSDVPRGTKNQKIVAFRGRITVPVCEVLFSTHDPA